jgi:hypothetical protein
MLITYQLLNIWDFWLLLYTRVISLWVWNSILCVVNINCFGTRVKPETSLRGLACPNSSALLTTHLRQLFSNKNNDWHLSKIESRHTWPGYPWKEWRRWSGPIFPMERYTTYRILDAWPNMQAYYIYERNANGVIKRNSTRHRW